jgi:hypothetical protein
MPKTGKKGCIFGMFPFFGQKLAKNAVFWCFSAIFHAMETFFQVFPRYGKKFSTLWKTQNSGWILCFWTFFLVFRAFSRFFDQFRRFFPFFCKKTPFGPGFCGIAPASRRGGADCGSLDGFDFESDGERAGL